MHASDYLQTKMQTRGRLAALGIKPHDHGIIRIWRNAVAKGGIRRLWTGGRPSLNYGCKDLGNEHSLGSIPNIQGAALGNAGDIAVYDKAKQVLTKDLNIGVSLSNEVFTLLLNVRVHFQDNALTHTISGFVAGFAGCLFATPADVMRVRIMNQPTDARGQGGKNRSS